MENHFGSQMAWPFQWPVISCKGSALTTLWINPIAVICGSNSMAASRNDQIMALAQLEHFGQTLQLAKKQLWLLKKSNATNMHIIKTQLRTWNGTNAYGFKYIDLTVLNTRLCPGLCYKSVFLDILLKKWPEPCSNKTLYRLIHTVKFHDLKVHN